MRLIDELMGHPLFDERDVCQILGPLGFDVYTANEEVPYEGEEPEKHEAFCRDSDAYMSALTFSGPEGFTEIARFDTEDADIVMLAVKPTTPLAHLLMLPADSAPFSATIEGAPTHASADVLAERRRQIEVEGWSFERDDGYVDGEMALAASCYARAAIYEPTISGPDRYMTPPYWPWISSFWKPTDTRRNLVKAGALILAEIERLDRAAQRHGGEA